MTGFPSLTSATDTTTDATTTAPSAASTPMCAPKVFPSGRPPTGLSTGNDGEVLRRGPGNSNGVINLLSCAENLGKKVTWSQSKSFQFSSPMNMGLEDVESPRFQEILRVTKKKTPFTKSYSSIEPSYKGVHVHAQMEEAKWMIREKFNKAKEQVNDELAMFAGELMNTVEQSTESDPEWKQYLDHLLLVSHQSAQMSAEEFWSKCEGIVLNLDHRRHELPMGEIKQAHTRLLFILTRCSRLVQCQ